MVPNPPFLPVKCPVNGSNYKSQSTGMKEWYLLSVFLGDVIRDANLCKQLAKRLTCGPAESEEEVSFDGTAFVYRN